MRSIALMMGALLATAALLSACSAGTPAPKRKPPAAAKVGPLVKRDSATICIPDPPGHWVTMGWYPLQNEGKSPITIRSVRMPADANIRMTKAWLVPIYYNPKNGTHNLLGVLTYYPPVGQPNWDKREPAVGGVVPPGGLRTAIDLVFGVTRMSATVGRSSGVVIGYTAGGRTYTVEETTSITLKDVCGP